MINDTNNVSSISVTKHIKNNHPRLGGYFLSPHNCGFELSAASTAKWHWVRILRAERAELARKRQALESSPKANTLVPLPKNSTSFDLSNFFIQAAGLAYHHDAVVDIISPFWAVSHHALACIYLRLDDIQHIVLMIYKAYALMIYNAPH